MTTGAQHILVTGGAGYIGSHTCKALAAAGYIPVTYDSLVRGNRWAVKWGPLEEGDLLDGERLREVMRAYGPVGVIHFAAFAYVGESMHDPLLYYRNNVAGTVSLLEAMAAERVGRLVFSSTCATYGVPPGNPIREDMPQAPINPYGQSKLMIEQVLKDCAATGTLAAVALRYFNAAGADPAGEIGEAHHPETHLIPLALAAAKGEAEPLTIFGDDQPTPDGTCIRDYIHVTDLADAHVRALGHTATNAGFAAFNLGTGKGASILDIIAATQRVTGRRVPHGYGPPRAGDPAELVADPSRAKAVLGWEARHSDLDTILSTAWNWMQRA
ncbi:UDP-glucose 4-epimerase GalE [Erythrobacter arachoides]|uniref:UDP-glucose 4-epimerase n=1 Tax=Aurantiacibacter arachoides TaxID=1850444 RepID=A0A845A2J9_9SPHN|nr:UDP-glucose 4-epimerase GalE [Aurantiacibacter arachoides]MXO93376.1 UDP-glucose 4-epimerase GalE [Aurantiacibacter arachoides]GGD49872.1 UDP-glucose 4-epimerase GalE [Aurantiacibacter arachoides]